MRHRSPYALLSSHHILTGTPVRIECKIQNLDFYLIAFGLLLPFIIRIISSSTPTDATTSFSINWFSVFLILISINQQMYCYIHAQIMYHWIQLQRVNALTITTSPRYIRYRYMCVAIRDCVHCSNVNLIIYTQQCRWQNSNHPSLFVFYLKYKGSQQDRAEVFCIMLRRRFCVHHHIERVPIWCIQCSTRHNRHDPFALPCMCSRHMHGDLDEDIVNIIFSFHSVE